MKYLPLLVTCLFLSACVPALAGAEDLPPMRTEAPVIDDPIAGIVTFTPVYAPTPATPDLMAIVGYLESLQTPDPGPVLTAAQKAYQIQETQIAIAVANQAAEQALKQAESQAEQARLDALNMLARTATAAPLVQTQQSLESTQAADKLALDAQGAALAYIAATTATADAGSLFATQTIAKLSADGTEIENNNLSATATEHAQPRNQQARAYTEQTAVSIQATQTQRALDGQEFIGNSGRSLLVVLILGVAGAFLVALLWLDSLRRERLINARAAAARSRVVGVGSSAAFASDNGAQPIPQAPHPDAMRPLINMSAIRQRSKSSKITFPPQSLSAHLTHTPVTSR